METLKEGLVFFETAESFLGDSRKRYSTSAYKRIKIDLSDFTIVDNNKLVGLLKIHWPAIWAEKTDKTLIPHVGSLEYFAIAAQMAELYLKIMENFSTQDIQRSWINKFQIMASNEAETEIENQECECLKNNQQVLDQHRIEVTFSVKIRKTVVLLSLVHYKIDLQSSISINKLINIYDNCNLSYFSHGYKIPTHQISDISIDKKNMHLTANVEIFNQELTDVFKGLGSSYQPCLNYCDCILVVGQLSQILLFTIDGISRDNASNLWMRSIKTTYSEKIDDSCKMELKIEESKILTTRNISYRSSIITLNVENKLLATMKYAYKL